MNLHELIERVKMKFCWLDDLLLVCPSCNQRKWIPREWDHPEKAVKVTNYCPDCLAGFDDVHYFDSKGREIRQLIESTPSLPTAREALKPFADYAKKNGVFRLTGRHGALIPADAWDAAIQVLESRATVLYTEGEINWYREVYAKLKTIYNDHRKALFRARDTIKALHGEVAWPEYQHSPEMKEINEVLRGCVECGSTLHIHHTWCKHAKNVSVI
jgi:hypothetical protein